MTEDTEDKIVEYITAGSLVIMGIIVTGLLVVIALSAVEGFLGISLMAKTLWVVVLAAFVKTVIFVRKIINEKDLI